MKKAMGFWREREGGRERERVSEVVSHVQSEGGSGDLSPTASWQRGWLTNIHTFIRVKHPFFLFIYFHILVYFKLFKYYFFFD